jgi:Holliday junction resolvase RusA-like endonuclease
MKFTIFGIPKPKGNSRQVWRIKGKRRVIMAPSKAFLDWQKAVKKHLDSWGPLPLWPIDFPVRVKAVFYRDARADVDNLCKALGDCLQHCGVIKNDRLIGAWVAERRPPDGNPRVEIEIEKLS